ncbi:MAG: CBS domain-containing protein [Gammaproteobacteria bacterium]|jgi:predicted transcriptional regulator|nr:CBS domain-containing protein [Gammaproteobacteria bacterium]
MAERKWVPVSEVMHREVTEIDGGMNVLEALKIMKQVQATCLIVKRRHERDEYGMLLFSDIAKHVIGKDRAPERVNVYEIMAKPVISVRPEMDIRYCARLFETFGIGHAPVIDETHTVVGIASYYVLALEALPTLE